MNTCSALITIPCFSEIVSAAIFSPNYFPLLWGLGSGLEPKKAGQGGQETGGRVSVFYLAGNGEVCISVHNLTEINSHLYQGGSKLQPLPTLCEGRSGDKNRNFCQYFFPHRELLFPHKTKHIPETTEPYIASHLFFCSIHGNNIFQLSS